MYLRLFAFGSAVCGVLGMALYGMPPYGAAAMFAAALTVGHVVDELRNSDPAIEI